MPDKNIRLQRVTVELPHNFDALRAEAREEHYAFIERLFQEWHSAANRFDRTHEQLLAAFLDTELAGIGGITHDPLIDNALRMRRFYVRPSARGFGIGRALVHELLAALPPACKITVHAGTTSALKFWDAIGFLRSSQEGITHVIATPFQAKSELP